MVYFPMMSLSMVKVFLDYKLSAQHNLAIFWGCHGNPALLFDPFFLPLSMARIQRIHADPTSLALQEIRRMSSLLSSDSQDKSWRSWSQLTG